MSALYSTWNSCANFGVSAKETSDKLTPFGWSDCSRQKMIGPRCTATRPASSATRGLEVIISVVTGKSRVTLSPDFQLRLIGRYCPACTPSTDFPFTATFAFCTQLGIRTNKVKSVGCAGETFIRTDPSHG